MSIRFAKSLCHEAGGGDSICPRVVIPVANKNIIITMKGKNYGNS